VQANSSAAAQPAVRATGNVVAAATGTGAGHAAALVVQGSAAFTRSGVLTIPAGAMSAATPLIAGGLSATAHVLATCQTHVASGAQPQIQSAVFTRHVLFRQPLDVALERTHVLAHWSRQLLDVRLPQLPQLGDQAGAGHQLANHEGVVSTP